MKRQRAYLKKMIPMAPPVSGESGESPSVESLRIADDVVRFLRRYLVCEPAQADILALWVIYTWCFQHFSTATYLMVRSPEPQCGKSLCLELLALLCDEPWLSTGADSRTIAGCLLNSDNRIRPEEKFVYRPPYTILLDDCHQAFLDSERQPLVAMLNSGARASGRYARYRCEYCVFGPKAFAENNNDDLPRSLASRCIPIVLHRRKPSEALSRFHRDLPPADTESLVQCLADWAEDNAATLAEAADRAPECLPPGLTPHQQDCAEPLLHVADLVGGPWPDKARAALATIFNFAGGSRSVQLLSDVREAFASRNYPEYLATCDLLSVIGRFEHRPWSEWPRNSGRRLSTLLHPFGILSRNLRVDAETVLRGYLLRDFHDAWERYLSPSPCSTTDFVSATEITASGAACSAQAD